MSDDFTSDESVDRYRGTPDASTACAASIAWEAPARAGFVRAAFCCLVELALERREVGKHELQLQNAECGERVVLARDRVVLEAAQDETERVDLPDSGEKAIPETLTVLGARNEPGDVDHLDRRLDDLPARAHRRERGEPVIGDMGDADRRLRRRERMRGHRHVRTSQRVEQRGFP